MKYFDAAHDAVIKASKIVMRYYGKEKGIRFKSEIDPVTKADVESEKIIVETLKKRFPGHGFIVEEGQNVVTSSGFVWIIDPLDGTTGFAHNYPMFSVSVALYKDNLPLLGIVNVPYLKEMLHAEANKGAFLNGHKILVSKVKTLKESLIGTGFPYSRLSSNIDNLNYFNKVAKKAGELRRSGSAAIDICYVACGRLDGYWEIGLKRVDTAAALLILSEAGGKSTDLKGNILKADYSCIAASNGLVHNELLNTLKEAE